mgnify:FL=1
MKKYLLKVKKMMILLILIYAMISLVSIFNPIVSARLLTSLTEFNINQTYKFGALFFLVSVITVIFNKLAVKVMSYVEERLLYEIRCDMIERLMNYKIKNFDNSSSGEFLNRIKNDPQDIVSVFSIVQYNIFNMITEVFMLIYVFYLNFLLGIIYFIGIAFIYFYEKYSYIKLEKLQNNLKNQMDKNDSNITEIIRGIKDIKLLGISNKIKGNTMKSFEEQVKNNASINIFQNNIYNNVEMCKVVITALIIFVGLFLINNNLLTLSTFLIIFLYRNDIFSLIFSYTSLKEYLVRYKVAKNRIKELFDENKYPIQKYGDIDLKNINGIIEFKNITFSYDNKRKVLDNISFKIDKCEDVAIVGKSGSGKSTIFNLLTKCYDNYQGTIFIDGVDIRDLSYSSITNNISIINQNPYLFNLTIKENLKLLDRNITDKEMIVACKIANIHEDIIKLPNKYNTLLGEGGLNLSGGQKQRLAIARALLKRSKILLFDEATSSLDNITQKNVQTAIKNISKDCTIVTIAHRFSTIIDVNKIIVLKDGKKVIEGKHEDLLNNDYYNSLYISDKIVDDK